MFYPGETIAHSYVIPFALAEIAKVVVSYKQNEAIILDRVAIPPAEGDETTHDYEFISIDKRITKVIFTFSQAQSLNFKDDQPFTTQINVYTVGGTRHTSHECRSSSGVQYLRDVMTNG